MLIGTSFKGELCNDITLKEQNANHEASSYIIENYKYLKGYALSKGVCVDKVDDLLQDVFMSVYSAEKNGEGFDETYGDGIMDVGNFVRGRINGYANNHRYRGDVVECRVSKIEEYITEEHVKTDIHGNPIVKRGKVQTQTITEKVKKQYTIAVYSASGADPNSETESDGFQTAYANAAVSDSIGDIEEAASLREEIDTCIDICELHGFNILNVFKNIELLDSMLMSNSSKKKSADSVFYKLSSLVREHDLLAENLMSVLRFSSASDQNRQLFKEIIKSY